MPRPLGGGFLKVLQSLSALANEDGVVRFRRSGDGIPLGRIADGARCDVKDARRYLRAAMAAGLVKIVGEARKGFAVVYALLVPGWEPDWTAAVDSLADSRRKRRRAPGRPVWADEDWAGQPSDEESQFGEDPGGAHPGEGRGTVPPGGEGGGPPATQAVPHGGGSQAEIPVVAHVQAPRAGTRVTREAEEQARQWREFALALPVDLRLAAVDLPLRHPSRLAAVAAMSERGLTPAELARHTGRGWYWPDTAPKALLVARLDTVLAGPPAPARTAAQAAARAAVLAATQRGPRR
ncbi:hypothetical protein [Kitasatospora sp. NPDC057223]|uniref:hypothetical protein n=1 Tax=Kitasatospora sp. NPDC057223 TaxID=3346055 RepID=UPI003624AFF0